LKINGNVEVKQEEEKDAGGLKKIGSGKGKGEQMVALLLSGGEKKGALKGKKERLTAQKKKNVKNATNAYGQTTKPLSSKIKQRKG